MTHFMLKAVSPCVSEYLSLSLFLHLLLFFYLLPRHVLNTSLVCSRFLGPMGGGVILTTVPVPLTSLKTSLTLHVTPQSLRSFCLSHTHDHANSPVQATKSKNKGRTVEADI